MNKILLKKNKSTRGFTLVETLVAISIFSVSVLGLLALLSQGTANTSYAKKKMIASYLAQEGIEYTRNVRDNYMVFSPGTGWTNFRALTCTAASPCGFNSSSASYPGFTCASQTCKLYFSNGAYEANSSSGSDSGFTREIWIDNTISANESKIFSRVSWTQNSTNYKVTFSEHLFNWAE